MNKKLLFFTLLGVLAMPVMAGAQTVQSIATNVVNNVVWPVALAAVIIFWLITGILFLSALGDPSKLGIAKKALFASIGGTVIVVLAASAIALIKNTLGI